MVTSLIALSPDASLQQAENIFSAYKIRSVPIVEGGDRLVEILTNHDPRFLEPTAFDQLVSYF